MERLYYVLSFEWVFEAFERINPDIGLNVLMAIMLAVGTILGIATLYEVTR